MRCRPGGTRSRVETLLKLIDQLSEVLGLPGKLVRALALAAKGALCLPLALLAFLDEQRQPLSLICEHEQITGKRVAFLGDLPAQPHELGEIDRKHVSLLPQFRKH